MTYELAVNKDSLESYATRLMGAEGTVTVTVKIYMVVSVKFST